MRILIILTLMIMLLGCVENVNKTDEVKIAKNFIESSPTFSYDGIPGSIEVVDKERVNDGWKITLKFRCRSAGYGNRSGMMVAQVITEHIAEIVIRDHKVISAIYDGKWDELAQKPIGK